MSFFTPVRAILLFVISAIIGALAIPYLRIDLLSRQSGAALSVKYQSEKSSAEYNEIRYTSILENALSQLTQLKHLSSVSTESGGEITISFDPRASLPQKRFEAAMLIRQCYTRLPAGISYPQISIAMPEGKMDAQAIRVYMISGPAKRSTIQSQASALISKSFYQLREIQEVEIMGNPAQELSILFDPVKCKAWHITPQQITSTLQENFKAYFPGSIQKQGQQLNLMIEASLTDPAELSRTTICNSKGQTISLADIAEIRLQEKSNTDYYRIDGENGLNVNIYPKPGINAVRLSRQLDETVNAINAKLPEGYSLKLVYDKTAYLQTELHKNYRRSLLSIAVLLLFILIAYRSFSASVILLSGLVVNLCITALLALIFQVNINLYTIGGITLAFGLMIDNAIVMLDHYQKRSNLYILPALAGANISIILGVALIYLLPEETRDNFQDFAAIIILSLCSSVAVALGFTPAVAVLIGASKRTAMQQRFKANRKRFKVFSFYRQLITTLSRFAFLVILFYSCLLAGGYYVFQKNHAKHTGIRNPEQSKIYLTCNMSQGHTATHMNALFQLIEPYLKQQTGIDKFITYIESGQYGGIEIFIKKAYAQTAYPFTLKAQLIRQCNAMEGANWHVWGLGSFYNTGNNEKRNSYQILLKGYQYQQLRTQAEKLQTLLHQNESVEQVNINERFNFRDYDLKVNRYISNTNQHINSKELLQVIQLYSSETQPIAQAYLQGENIPVYLRENSFPQRSQYQFLHQQMTTDSGAAYTLGSVGSISTAAGNSKLYKQDRQYLRVVSYDYIGEPDEAIAYQKSIIAQFNQQLPSGFSASKHLQDFNNPDEKYPVWLLLLLLVINFIITAVIFENIVQPFLIIAMIPIAFTGLLYTFGWANTSIDQGGYAAFIMLGSLAVNASIFLVNDSNQFIRQRKRDSRSAIASAFYFRSRPVILTILACCCGLLPFLYDGKNEIFWFAFAVGSLSGLLFFIIPLFTLLPAIMVAFKK